MSASNPPGAVSADYVVIGAGAMGMAFADVILSETDATIAMVDRVQYFPMSEYLGDDNRERARIRNLGARTADETTPRENPAMPSPGSTPPRRWPGKLRIRHRVGEEPA